MMVIVVISSDVSLSFAAFKMSFLETMFALPPLIPGVLVDCPGFSDSHADLNHIAAVRFQLRCPSPVPHVLPIIFTF